MDALETIEYKGYKIKIHQDDIDESPREWNNIGTMACWHRGYNLGDDCDCKKAPKDIDVTLLQQLVDRDDVIALPLYIYDHGMLRMKVGSFYRHIGYWHARFDSGQVGYIYVEYEALRREFGWKRITKARRKRATEILETEVEIYDQYLSGDVYGYIVEDENGNHLNSCWGFYGSEWDKNGLLHHAKPAIDHHIAEEAKQEDLIQSLLAVACPV